MYALYDKTRSDSSIQIQYQFNEKISLFGCKSGYIPWLLSEQLATASSEPYKWHVNIESSLKDVKQDDQTLIIDLKPKKKENLSLYEVQDVWGYSASGWTPILLHLRGLFVDEDPDCFDRNNFVRNPREIGIPIFSMMYLAGTVKDGKLNGKWTTPGPSPTNSVLLWPDAFKYFWQQAENFINNVDG